MCKYCKRLQAIDDSAAFDSDIRFFAVDHRCQTPVLEGRCVCWFSGCSQHPWFIQVVDLLKNWHTLVCRPYLTADWKETTKTCRHYGPLGIEFDTPAVDAHFLCLKSMNMPCHGCACSAYWLSVCRWLWLFSNTGQRLTVQRRWCSSTSWRRSWMWSSRQSLWRSWSRCSDSWRSASPALTSRWGLPRRVPAELSQPPPRRPAALPPGGAVSFRLRLRASLIACFLAPFFVPFRDSL